MLCFLRNLKVLLLCAIVLSIIIEPSFSQTNQNKLNFKFSGGLTYLDVGSLNDHNTDWNKTRRRSVEAAGGTVISENQELHWGSEVSGELILNIYPKFALSVGTGYIYGQLLDDIAETQTDDITAYVTHDITVGAVPLRVGGHFIIPISSATKLSLDAGMSYYLANFNKFYRREPGDGYWIDNYFRGKGDGLGFDGGITFEYSISNNISLIVEGHGRYTKISGVEGSRGREDSNDWSDFIDGKYYSLERERESGIWSRVFNISKSTPGGDNLRNVEDGVLDFSGFYIRAGLSFGIF